MFQTHIHKSKLRNLVKTDAQRFMGLRKVNTIGLEGANKCIHLSATAYNLKKLLEFAQNRANPIAIANGAGVLAFQKRLKGTLTNLFWEVLGQ